MTIPMTIDEIVMTIWWSDENHPIGPLWLGVLVVSHSEWAIPKIINDHYYGYHNGINGIIMGIIMALIMGIQTVYMKWCSFETLSMIEITRYQIIPWPVWPWNTVLSVLRPVYTYHAIKRSLAEQNIGRFSKLMIFHMSKLLPSCGRNSIEMCISSRHVKTPDFSAEDA